jgi:hypothetical protein
MKKNKRSSFNNEWFFVELISSSQLIVGGRKDKISKYNRR